ncbi:hypothetical protein [Streptomyces beihaiensis]|uniref:DUF3137 domain-containing protein n=1 Tax=Streptomyces beihaiensis TaxID=2984495 RepID=A0ABT3TZH6_9ACTN|nr:hypothetical protein [Streptomyces beihaiensis]MCX3061782.1 hypothetical protein [Streptomyces beihaiensis]
MEQLAGIVIKVLLFAVVAGIFTFVIRAFISSNKQESRISEGWAGLQRLASERGWTYERRAPGRATRYCGVGTMPGSGENLTAHNYVTGEFRGRSFVCFEYAHVGSRSDGGDRKRPVIESFVLVAAPGPGACVEILRPSMFNVLLDRRERMLVGSAAFDDRFRVVTKDEGFARELLGCGLMPFLLDDSRAEHSPLQLRDGDLFTWYTGTLSAESLEEKLGFLCDVLDRVPAGVWR